MGRDEASDVTQLNSWRTAPVITPGRVSERAKWLTEQAFPRRSNISNTSASQQQVALDDFDPSLKPLHTNFSVLNKEKRRSSLHTGEKIKLLASSSEDIQVTRNDRRLSVPSDLKLSTQSLHHRDTKKKELVSQEFSSSISVATPKSRVAHTVPTSVQRRRQEMERKVAEEKYNSNPKNFHKTSWKSTQHHGKYNRKAVDVRGVAPKKSLADLP